MAKKRKRGRRLESKFAIRRFILLIILLALLAGGGVYAGYLLAGEKKKPGEESAAEAIAIVSQSSSSSSSVQEEEEESAESESESTQEGSEAEESQDGEADLIKEAVAAKAMDWNLILVNKVNSLPDNFEVELETVVGEYKVDARAREPLLRMIAGAKEDGIILLVSSAYRTPEYQETLFENYKAGLVNGGMEEEEAVAATSTVITFPGTSEHHTGLAVDIVTPEYQGLDEGFAETPAFAWLRQNAARFGFILRYPKAKQDVTDIIYEPWHYRYVGVEDAAAINKGGYCLEEYIDMLKAGGPNSDSEEENMEDEPLSEEKSQ